MEKILEEQDSFPTAPTEWYNDPAVFPCLRKASTEDLAALLGDHLTPLPSNARPQQDAGARWAGAWLGRILCALLPGC